MSATTGGKQAGFGLVVLLVVVAIIAVSAGYLYFGKSSTSTKEQQQLKQLGVQGSQGSVLKQSMDKAKETECMSNLRQVRQALQMASMDTGTFPHTLEELHLPAEMLKCPVSGKPYLYDPSTGRVQCPTHPTF